MSRQGPRPPQHVLNSAIVAAMRDHEYRPGSYFPQSWRGWCNMLPVVTDWAPGPTDPAISPDDVWWVLVQYHTSGSLASYGVDRNNIASCYTD